MSFGQLQLEKFGWNKGEGVGKNKTGIKRALTVSKKYDLLGIGTARDSVANNWWETLYNNSSKKIKSVNLDEDGDSISSNRQSKKRKACEDQPDLIPGMIDPLKFNNPNRLYNQMFTKPASSDSPINDIPENSSVDSSAIVSFVKSSSEEIDLDSSNSSVEKLTDEQLFAACEGRTARKGARAEQPGKLSRVSKNSGMPNPDIVKMIELAQQGHSEALASQFKTYKPEKVKEKSIKKNKGSKKDKKSSKKDKKKSKKK
ncbi:G patch domain-containing protein 4 [Smittium mucronatum]|uniref:G patch domain-containing protein 4 n=1 Tax=Smittium mucronatum TaxID=133383 RepID=A0A1R0H0P2_9FUNG|nr:G patch domain-containing protein 4 [Smittium mucronatum]